MFKCQNYFFIFVFSIFCGFGMSAMDLKRLGFGEDYSDFGHCQELAALTKRLDQWEKRVKPEEEYRERSMGRLLKELGPHSRMNSVLNSSDSLKKVVVVSVRASLRKRHPLSRSKSSCGTLSRRASWNSAGSGYFVDQKALEGNNVFSCKDENKENESVVATAHEFYVSLMGSANIVNHDLFTRIENIKK